MTSSKLRVCVCVCDSSHSCSSNKVPNCRWGRQFKVSPDKRRQRWQWKSCQNFRVCSVNIFRWEKEWWLPFTLSSSKRTITNIRCRDREKLLMGKWRIPPSVSSDEHSLRSRIPLNQLYIEDFQQPTHFLVSWHFVFYVTRTYNKIWASLSTEALFLLFVWSDRYRIFSPFVRLHFLPYLTTTTSVFVTRSRDNLLWLFSLTQEHEIRLYEGSLEGQPKHEKELSCLVLFTYSFDVNRVFL